MIFCHKLSKLLFPLLAAMQNNHHLACPLWNQLICMKGRCSKTTRIQWIMAIIKHKYYQRQWFLHTIIHNKHQQRLLKHSWRSQNHKDLHLYSSNHRIHHLIQYHKNSLRINRGITHRWNLTHRLAIITTVMRLYRHNNNALNPQLKQ